MSTTISNKTNPVSVLKIIAACKSSGVIKLTWGDLSIEFGSATNPIVEYKEFLPDTNNMEDSKVISKSEQLDLIKIENPEEWEKLNMMGDVNEDN